MNFPELIELCEQRKLETTQALPHRLHRCDGYASQVIVNGEICHLAAVGSIVSHHEGD